MILQVIFRADASLTIGTGHVMRCLTLADALRERGAECRFVCREHPGHLLDFIRARGHEAIGLPSTNEQLPSPLAGEGPGERERTAHAAWLGTDWATDARQTLAAIGSIPVDWLIVDHYALDARWEQALRPSTRRLMVIDDLADRLHDGDVLMDQNWFGASTAHRYAALIPPHALKRLGPGYALLKPEYAWLRALLPPRDGTVRRVLVFMGGSDPSNQTAKVLQALMAPDLALLAVDVVIGINHPDPAGIANLATARPATHLYQNLSSLAGLMARADLAIGAGGATSWERMCLGLPAIVISLAANQTPTNQALAEAGYLTYLGEMATVTPAMIAGAVRHCLAVPDELKAQSTRMQQLVPGDGVARVCASLLEAGERRSE